MLDWLDPVRAALDASPTPVEFYLRDDDVGWEDRALFALLDVVERHGLPLDLAVIPCALGPGLAESLAARASGGRLGLHQHGLSHRSHEPDGYNCEFGPSRGRASQRADLLKGRELLEALLPGHVQPVFTPPWNRCTATTAGLLRELGFTVLCRYVDETPFDLPGLHELRATLDWSFGLLHDRRLTPGELGELAAERVRGGAPVGLILHHAVMDRAELARFGELCALLAEHPSAHCRPLLAVTPPARPA